MSYNVSPHGFGVLKHVVGSCGASLEQGSSHVAPVSESRPFRLPGTNRIPSHADPQCWPDCTRALCKNIAYRIHTGSSPSARHPQSRTKPHRVLFCVGVPRGPTVCLGLAWPDLLRQAAENNHAHGARRAHAARVRSWPLRARWRGSRLQFGTPCFCRTSPAKWPRGGVRWSVAFGAPRVPRHGGNR